METIRLPALDAPVAGEFDVAVAGGGAAGLAAAISAARLGSHVALIELEGLLGGNAGPGGVSTVCGMHWVEPGGKMRRIVGGVAEEIVQSLKNSGSAAGPFPFKGSSVIPFNPWAFARECDEMAMAEKNLRLFLHARVIGVIAGVGKPAGLVIHQVGGLRAIKSSVIVDATGDAEVARSAGAELRRGEHIMYPSMMFSMANADSAEVLWRNPGLFAKLLDEHWDDPEYRLPRREGALIPTMRPREAQVAATRITVGGRDDPPADAAEPDQLTLAEIEGRRQVDEVARFVREIVPGFKESYVSHVAPRIGVRETLTILGEFTLTENDIINAGRFPDAVAANSWPIEDHIAGGKTEWIECPPGKFYQVPYRCLIPQKVDGLLAAGRCFSATHKALASARTIAICMATGQAAGTAAHIAAREKIAPRKVSVKNLQQILTDNGAIIERE